jgi:dTDP-glucose 4,6-dehydratase/UDP-glucose 4-epimerase
VHNKRVLVTGGAGFLGSAWVAALLERGNDVRVLDNRWRAGVGQFDERRGELDFVEADVRDADAVRRACRGVDAVAHFASINGTEHFYNEPALVLEVAVKGMTHVLDAVSPRGSASCC